MKPRVLTILLVSVLAVLCIAGTKLSRITRTQVIQTNSLFLVSTQAADGRWSSRGIALQDVSSYLGSGGGGGGSIQMGAELFVDATTGNDNTGTRGRPDKAFATPHAAKLAAQEGDAIIVNRGTYTGAGVSNLFKAGKLTWILDDPTFDYIDQSTTPTTGSGIFDDRFAGGPVTNTVLGSVKLKYCSGTNVVFDGICNPYDIASNHLGVIVVTNALSEIQWSAHTDIRHWGQIGHPFAIWVANCAPLTYFKNINLVSNASPGLTFIVSNCPAAPGVPIEVALGANGFYWQLGTFSLQFGRAVGPFTTYAIDAYGVTNTDRADMIINGDFLDGKCYIVGQSKDWKVWSRITEMQNNSDNPNLIELFNGGSHYFESQKVSTKSGVIMSLDNPGLPPDTNLVVWVDFMKAAASNGWLNVEHGALRGRIGHFEQNGPNNGTPGILVTNVSALVSLSGENAYSANTFLDHGGGVTELHGYNATTTNRDPVIVRSSGLTLDVAGLNTISGTNSIRASSAQTVTIQRGYTGPPPHANVTLTGSNRVSNLTAYGGTTATNINSFAIRDVGDGVKVIGPYTAGNSYPAGVDSLLIGLDAGANVPDIDDVVAVGDNAASGSTSIAHSAVVGRNAGATSAGSASISALGANALWKSTNSTYTIGIGASAGEGAGNSARSIFIGAQAGMNTHRNYTLAIDGDESKGPGSTNALIYGEFDNRLLRVNGTFNVPAFTGIISNALVTNSLTINAGISNLIGTNALFIRAGVSNLVVTNEFTINAGISNAVVTNSLTINAGVSNLLATNASVRLGAGTSNAYVGGAIYQDFTAYTNHSTASLNVTNLGTFTLPAHSLTNAGDMMLAYWSGRFQNATAMTNQLMFRFGSLTNVLDSGLQTASNTVYEVWCNVTGISATKQRVEARLRWGVVNSGVTGVPWLETNVVSFIAESNGLANVVGLYHAGQRHFAVTNEAIRIDWRKGYR